MSSSVTTFDAYNFKHQEPLHRFLYHLNPLAKAFGPLPAMIAVIFTRDIPTPLALIVLSILLILLGAKLNLKTALTLFLVGPIMVFLLAISFGIWSDTSQFNNPTPIVELFGWTFYLENWQIGLTTATRLSSLVCLALIGGLTTTGPDLVRSLIQQLKLPYRIGYTALAAYRFVPRFAYEFELIRSAHRVRGLAGGRGPFAGIKRYLGYIVPLLAGAIRHAERVALAMDSRAFGAHSHRTERYLIPWRIWDWVFLIGFWIITAAIFLLPRFS